MANEKTKYRFDEYLDMRTWKKTPVTDAWKDKLAEELYNWAKDDPEAFKMTQFYLHRGISSTDFMRWVETHEKLKIAHDAALQMIGDRREIGAAKNKLNTAIVLSSMPRYDKGWKELSEWRAALKAQHDPEQGPTIVVVDSLEALEEQKKTIKKSKKN